jgi:hypothetical protein
VTQPIVFLSHFQVKSGGLADYRRLADQVTRQLEAERPRTAAYLHYLQPDVSRLTIVHVFPDSSAMDSHFEGAAERSEAAFEYITPLGWEIYGPASDAAATTIRDAATAAGVDLTVAAQHLGGFLRFLSA